MKLERFERNGPREETKVNKVGEGGLLMREEVFLEWRERRLTSGDERTNSTEIREENNVWAKTPWRKDILTKRLSDRKA